MRIRNNVYWIQTLIPMSKLAQFFIQLGLKGRGMAIAKLIDGVEIHNGYYRLKRRSK